jgi:hypothetical protein
VFNRYTKPNLFIGRLLQFTYNIIFFLQIGETYGYWMQSDISFFGLYLTRVVGCTLDVLEMPHSYFVSYLLFRWLIYSAILVDP